MLDKNLQKSGKAIQIHVFRDSFLTSLINFMFFESFDIFCQKIWFLGKKALKMFFRVFSLKFDYFNRFLVKFHSKMNILIYLTLLLFKLWQKRFSPKLTKLRPYHLIKVHQVCEFRDVCEFRVPPNLNSTE